MYSSVDITIEEA